MSTPPSRKIDLLVTDIDNTLFDWVTYYVEAFSALLAAVSKVIGVPVTTLEAESKEVFTKQSSIEYPFVIQDLPSVNRHYGTDIDRLLSEAVRQGRDAFLAAGKAHLATYPDVPAHLAEIRRRWPHVPIVALTDAPRYVAMWKLNKLKLLPYFAAVYGLADPRIPTSPELGRVKVDPDILLKHLAQSSFGFGGKIRILPDDYEKPGTKGLKTVLMDFDLDEDLSARQRVIWVGDNQRKDVGLGRRLGVRTAWAAYGKPDPGMLKRLLAFSPELNVVKNAAMPTDGKGALEPDVTLHSFAELIPWLALHEPTA